MIVIEQLFEEPGINDNGSDDDPYTLSSPAHMIEYLRTLTVSRRKPGTVAV